MLPVMALVRARLIGRMIENESGGHNAVPAGPEWRLTVTGRRLHWPYG